MFETASTGYLKFLSFLLNLRLNIFDDFVHRLFVLQEEMTFVLCVTTDYGRESKRAFAFWVPLHAVESRPFEERLGRFGRIVGDHDAILVHHQLNLHVALLRVVGLLHRLVD